MPFPACTSHISCRDDAPSQGSHIQFVVRNDASHSDILVQTSDTERAAYNEYGGNSLYACGTCSGRAAFKVSFNRPNKAAVPPNTVFSFEAQLISFLERNGYNIAYQSDVDTDRLGTAVLQQHKLFISSGHDEYWSGVQRSNVEAARDAGVNLAFFSGNESFWKIRYEPAIDGSNTSYRTEVSYKETFGDVRDPADPPVTTATWRDTRFGAPADGGRPENSMSGTMYMVDAPNTFAIDVPAADGKMRFWRNTSVASLTPGTTATLAPNTLGYEWDIDADNGFRPAGLFHLSTTTENVSELADQNFGTKQRAGVATHNMTIYRARRVAPSCSAQGRCSGPGAWTARPTARPRTRGCNRRRSICSPIWAFNRPPCRPVSLPRVRRPTRRLR